MYWVSHSSNLDLWKTCATQNKGHHYTSPRSIVPGWYSGTEITTPPTWKTLALSKLSVDRQAFVDQCKLVKNLVFNAKMNFYSTLISNASSNSRVLFKTIDRFLHRKPVKRLPYCVSPAELADRFAIFFMEKIDSLRNEFPVVDFPNYFHEIDNPILSCRLVNFSLATFHERFILVVMLFIPPNPLGILVLLSIPLFRWHPT